MYIVTAVNPGNGQAVDIQGVPHGGRVFGSNTVNVNDAVDYIGATRQVQSWSCTREEEVSLLVAALSTYFVGQDISVYKLESISIRAPGELKTKNVSKDGILPT